MHRFWFIFDTRNSSSVVKTLLAHQMATCPNSRGCRALGHFFLTHLLKPLNPFIDYESHVQDVRLQCCRHQSTTFVNCTTCEQNMWTYDSLWILLTQCVCTGSIKRSTLSVNIYIMYSC